MKKLVEDMKAKSGSQDIVTEAKAQHASTLNLNSDTDESEGTVQVLHICIGAKLSRIS